MSATAQHPTRSNLVAESYCDTHLTIRFPYNITYIHRSRYKLGTLTAVSVRYILGPMFTRSNRFFCNNPSSPSCHPLSPPMAMTSSSQQLYCSSRNDNRFFDKLCGVSDFMGCDTVRAKLSGNTSSISLETNDQRFLRMYTSGRFASFADCDRPSINASRNSDSFLSRCEPVRTVVRQRTNKKNPLITQEYQSSRSEHSSLRSRPVCALPNFLALGLAF